MSPQLPIIDYARHPAYGGMLEPDEALGRQALAVLEPLIEEQQALEAERREAFGYRYGGAGPLGQALAQAGLLRFHLPAPLMDPIGAAAAPLVAQITERLDGIEACGEAARFQDQAQPVDRDAHAGLWAALIAALRETGAFTLAAGFFGAPKSKLQSAQVLISRPRSGQAGGAWDRAAAEGLHIDSSGRCILKAVLYLDDVGPGQGPFGLVPGSHRWEAGGLGRVYRRAFDRSSLVGRGAKQRRAFISLPEAMQLKAEFGGDLLPDDPQTGALLESEASSIGPRGLLSLFDPEAIHRGGHAREAERRAILLTIPARW